MKKQLDAPDAPGWWAFEGSEWETKRVPCSEDEADGWHESDWDEGDEPSGFYYKNVETRSKPFRLVTEVKWVQPGQVINERKRHGPHRGEPVLGIVSPKYRWDTAFRSIDTVVGTWYRLTMPWDNQSEGEL